MPSPSQPREDAEAGRGRGVGPVPMLGWIPNSSFVIDHLDYWADCKPDHPALGFNGQEISYAGLQIRVDACARRLLSEGIRAGDRIAVLCTPRPEAVIIYLALARIGAVWVGLNPRHRQSELLHAVTTTGARLLFALAEFEGRDFRPEVESLCESNPSLNSAVLISPADEKRTTFDEFVDPGSGHAIALERASYTYPMSDIPRQPADPRCIIFTSGSTGIPKGALLSEQGLLRTMRALAARCVHPEFRTVTDLPINHVGIATMLYMSLIQGGTLHLCERFDPEALVELLEQELITCWIPPRVQFERCREYLRGKQLPALSHLGWAEASDSARVDEALALGADLIRCYGMTETSDVILIGEPGVPRGQLEGHNIGRPIPGVAVRLRGENGEPALLGEAGELQVRGDCLFLEYYGQPDATSRAFTADGWFKTGDLAVQIADGSFDYAGRKDDTFKSGGYNIYPREVELVIESCSGVRHAAVIGVPHEVWGAAGHAYVELQIGAGTTPEEIEVFLRGRLANYKVPKRIEVVPSLPTTKTEKIDRKALRAQAARTDFM